MEVLLNNFLLLALSLLFFSAENRCLELESLDVHQLRALAHCEAKCYLRRNDQRPTIYPCTARRCDMCRDVARMSLDSLEMCIKPCIGDVECRRMCECAHESLNGTTLSNSSHVVRPPTLACLDPPRAPLKQPKNFSATIILKLGLQDRNGFYLERLPEPVVFIVEMRTRAGGAWTPTAKYADTLLDMDYLQPNTWYQFRATALAPGGTLGPPAESEWIRTLPVEAKLAPPENLYVEKTFPEENRLSAKLKWTPPRDNYCYYKFYFYHEGSNRVLARNVFKLRDVDGFKISPLEFGRNYTIIMEATSKDEKQRSAKLTNWTLTEQCAEVFGNNFTLCGPGPPRNMNYVLLNTTKDRTSVKVSWLKPEFTSHQNKILHYVTSMEQEFDFSIFGPVSKLFNKTIEVSENASEVVYVEVPRGHTYFLSVMAVSSGGNGATGMLSLVLPKVLGEAQSSHTASTVLLLAGIPLASCVILVLIGIFGCKSYRRRKIDAARNSYFKSLEKAELANEEDVPILALKSDVYEVNFNSLLMEGELGQGAFGIVKKARMRNSKARKGWEYVAVKMLRPDHDDEEERQLMCEIEMSKNLGKHLNIVGLLAYCKAPNICLVVEYCKFGDLQKYLRKMRSGKCQNMFFGGSNCTSLSAHDNQSQNASMLESRSSSKEMSITYASLQRQTILSKSDGNSSKTSGYSSLDYANSIRSNGGSVFYGSRGQQQKSQDFYENDPTNIDDSSFGDKESITITPVDLLKYAHQISMGMEYLAQNKFVHRDLAARNVLMYDHRIVKIADFGLTRDVYEYSLYRKKTEGKLPIKWMAYESIFDHIFTTKSDVWSFGILLWEIVTLGGTPYPGISSTELIKLMQTHPGYKMEKPSNCSNEMYDIMSQCWQINAAKRLSFTELRFKFEAMLGTTQEYINLDSFELEEVLYQSSSNISTGV